MNYIISAKNVKKSYQKDKLTSTVVLRGINLKITEGDFIAFIGPSGAGKTTLLYILSTIDTPDEGEVSYQINGNVINIKSLGIKDLSIIRNKFIGFVFQFHHLLPEFSVLENVAMPKLISNEDWETAFSTSKRILDLVGMSHRLEHKPAELSGGEQQRVAIARAIVNNPRIVFADEPTGNLDTKNAENIIDLLLSLRHKMNLTLVIATHSMEIAQKADRIYYMKDGLIENQKN